MDDLISTSWLADRLTESDLVVLDASWFLPEHGRDPHENFASGHIPGARFLDLAALTDADDALPMMLPGDHAFNEAMRTLGISNDSRVVVYDDSPLHTSARAWWMLRLMGVPRVAILDGGLLGSKPYASSGAYIDRMSDYCRSCRYDVKQRVGPDACPFNALYWDFLARNRGKLGDNPRLSMPYRNWDRMEDDTQNALLEQARGFLQSLD